MILDADLDVLEEVDAVQDPPPLAGEEGKKSHRSRARAGAVDPTVPKKGRMEDESAPSPQHVLTLMGASKDIYIKSSVEFFQIVGTQLHCNLCGTTFGTRKNVWKTHIAGKRHVAKLGCTPAGPGRPATVQASLPQLVGSGIDAAANSIREKTKVETVHRVRVVRSVISSNMALSAIDGDMKELLEEKRDMRLSLGDTSNLARQTLPTISKALDQEDALTVSAGGGVYSLFFDGFCETDEHSLVVMRTCTKNFQLSERVASVRLWDGNLKGTQWVRIVDQARRRLGADGLVFSLADGHPSNGIVGETFLGLLEHYIHLFCTSHTLAVAGSKAKAPLVNEFSRLWHSILKNSPSARSLIKTKMGEEPQRKPKVRWFGALPMLEQAMRWYPKLSEIADAVDTEGYSKESVAALKAFLRTNCTGPTTDFAIQLAAFYDINRPLRDSCYFLEGSGFLAPFWFAHIGLIKSITTKVQSIDTSSTVMPNVVALIRTNPALSPQTAWGKARSVVDPTCLYFLDHFIQFRHDTKTRPFRKAFELFSFARIFHPVYGKMWINTNEFNLVAQLDVEVVKSVLGVQGPNFLEELKNDFSKYLTTIETKTEVGKKYRPDDLLIWWQEYGSECGAWAAAARLFALFQPSSASAERGFAMLRAAVGRQQQHTLEDMVEVRLRQRFSIKDTSMGMD